MQMIFNHPAMLYRSIDFAEEKATGSKVKARDASACELQSEASVSEGCCRLRIPSRLIPASRRRLDGRFHGGGRVGLRRRLGL